MSLYKTFKTDGNLETSGVYLNYGENAKGAVMRIKVARAGGSNRAFERLMTAKTRPIRRQIDTGTAANATIEGILREVYAECVILGWENICDENDVALPFNRENVIKVLTDLPDLFSDIRAQASELAIFRSDLLESAVKN